MTFSSKVKTELMNRDDERKPCCTKALVYGLLLFGRSFSASAVKLSTEYEFISAYYADKVKMITGVEPLVSENGKKYVRGIRTASDRTRVLDVFGHTGKELTLRINRANLHDECCFEAFLAGAFISCGTITTPEKTYHMEFSVSHQKLCKDLIRLMEELELSPKMTSRNNAYSIYFKNSESIEDVLVKMGATEAAMEIMGAKIQKDLINNANRRANFDNANISRIVDASTAQRAAIKLLRDRGVFEKLDDTAQRVAVLREENPIASLSELEELSGGEISRSGINHRLKKILKMADELPR